MEEKLKQAIEILREKTKQHIVMFEFLENGWRFLHFYDYTISFGEGENRRRLCKVSKEKEAKNAQSGFSSLDKCLDFIINYNETK